MSQKGHFYNDDDDDDDELPCNYYFVYSEAIY
jgi:hypothetical protein